MKRKAVLSLAIAWVFLGAVALAAASPPESDAANSGAALQVGVPGPSPAQVSDITIRPGTEGETIIVELSTSREVSYRVHQLGRPRRLVVDIDGAYKAVRRSVYPVHSEVLARVRVAQFRSDPPEVRVVADLLAEPDFNVHKIEKGLRIELKGRTTSTPQTAKTRTPGGPLSHAAGSAAVPTGFHYQNALPGAEEVAAAPREQRVAELPEVARAASAARIVAGSASLAGEDMQGEAEQLPQQPPPLPPEPTQERLTRYTGEPVSLNLKEVDLKDFFRLVHEISGLNIIVDPNVVGNVTLVLDAVPWDQALDIVLKNNGLGKALEGNVLRIARVDTLTAEQEAARKLADASLEAAPLVTVFRPVNYAKATTVAALLTKWTGGGALTKRGNVLVDERTNTLIVSDIQSQIPIIESIITKLDKKSKQVQIEARIIRANADFTRTLSSALAALFQNRSGSTLMTGVTGTGSTGFTGPDTPHPSPIATTTSVTGFGVYAVSNAGAGYVINAAIAAAESKSQVKTISRPTIVTQNNVPGTVQQGTQIPIQTTINNTISVQYVNATLQLQVTPQVTEDGNVFLQVQVKNASPGPALTFAGPSINTQEASTQVMVPDGGTVVFGGVTITTRSKSATYVPVLGNIPILGRLFKTSTIQDADQELLFFVTPKVLPG